VTSAPFSQLFIGRGGGGCRFPSLGVRDVGPQSLTSTSAVYRL
jgi:hypothetical protein